MAQPGSVRLGDGRSQVQVLLARPECPLSTNEIDNKNKAYEKKNFVDCSFSQFLDK